MEGKNILKCCKELFLCLGLMVCSPCLMAKPYAYSQTSSFKVDHFQALEALEYKHPLLASMQRLKNINHFVLLEDLHFKVSSLKSTLPKSNQHPNKPPGIQMREGFEGHTSKGFGVKFVYRFG